MVRIELVGGPLDGKVIRVILGAPKKIYQEPEVVERAGRREYHLHSYRLGKTKDGLPAYQYEASAMFV